MGDIKNSTEDIGHIVTADELVMDEATIIREQERMANEKKRKKAAKRRNVILIIFGVLAVGATVYMVWGRQLLNKEEGVTVKIETTTGQSVSFVKVNSINGNEVNYTVLKEQETSQNFEESSETVTESNKSQSETQSDSENSETGSAPSFGGGQMPSFGNSEDGSAPSFGGGQMPSFGDGEMPSFGNSEDDSSPSFGDGQMPNFGDGQMPSGFGGNSSDGSSERPSRSGDFSNGSSERPSRSGDTSNGSSERPSRNSDYSTGSKPSSGSSSSSGSSRGTRTGSSSVLTYENVTYVLSDETETTMIPVGTVVTTKLGTSTTFSRIAAGDCLAFVIEKIDGIETIMAVYIVG